MIPQDFIDQLQQRSDIAEIISGYIPLKKAGRNYKAVCPFHNEKTPSFFVSPQKQIFHCFGCGAGGGVIQFIMLYEKVNFVEAVEIIAQKVGMSVPKSAFSPQAKLKVTLYELAAEAVDFYRANLKSNSSASKRARDYLKKRGLSEEVISQFKIGYAPNSSRAVIDYMRKRGYSLNLLEKASLVAGKRSGGYIDLFRDRIIFPIFDVRHKAVGFGGRRLQNDANIPKYINSAENILYNKRQILFGLNLAKDFILKEDYAFVVEGYLDMITPYSGGIKNIVASLGTALTAEQISLLKRYTNNIFIVFDSDKAGQSAALRVLDTFLENDINVKIIMLPSGYDPDKLAREKGKDYFLHLAGQALDFFDFKMKLLKEKYSLSSINGKAEISSQMLSTIKCLPSNIKKYEYTKKLADILEIKEEVVFSELEKINTPLKSGMAKILKHQIAVPIAEKTVIKFIFLKPKLISLVKKELSPSDFSHSLARKTIEKIFEFEGEFNFRSFLNYSDDNEVNSFVTDLLMSNEQKMDKDIFKSCILKLRANRIKSAKVALREKIKEAEKKGDKKRMMMFMGEYKKLVQGV